MIGLTSLGRIILIVLGEESWRVTATKFNFSSQIDTSNVVFKMGENKLFLASERFMYVFNE